MKVQTIIYKRTCWPIAIFMAICLFVNCWPDLYSQEAPNQKFIAINVLEKDRCVSGLKPADLELTIDGNKHEIEGLIEINKKDILATYGKINEIPSVNRVHYLLFQLYDYLPELNEALVRFLSTAVFAGDEVEVQTPAHSYHLNPGALSSTPVTVAARQMADFLKKDITEGNSYYKSLIRDLRRFVQGIEGLNPMAGEQGGNDLSTFGLERLLNQYRDTLMKLESLRMLDEQKLINFAQRIKRISGQKFLYFIYQQEYRPELSQAMLNTLIANNQDNQNILSDLQDLFQIYHRDLKINISKIAELFSDSGVKVYFIFLEKIPERFGGIVMREQSEDIFKLFSSLSTATGGQVFSGNRLLPLLDKVIQISGCYYLVYFSPLPGEVKGHFYKVNVKCLSSSHQVLYPAGFYD